MDINQTPLSRYKTNKSGTASGSAAEARATAETSKSRGVLAASASQSAKQLDLKEGQLVKGQILDHRYDEVKIQLEPGKQVVTAKLSGDIPLSIGQGAQFLVTEGSSEHLVLKYLPEDVIPTDTTVQKALTASGLPMSERNKEIVSELLSQRMPIDKQTLQTLVKLSVMNREASPLSLVLMFKNNIPMTPANIKQFEAYQNNTRQLLQDIKTISQNISRIISQSDIPALKGNTDPQGLQLPSKSEIQNNINIETPVKNNGSQNVMNEAVQLINTAQNSDNPLGKSIQMNGKLIEILDSSSSHSGPTAAGIPINQILSKEELSLFSKAIVQKLLENPTSASGLPADIPGQINKGILSLEDAIKLITGLFSSDTEQSAQLQDVLKQLQISMQSNQAAAPVFSKLADQFMLLSDSSQGKLSDILDQSGRSALFGYLTGVPDPEGMKERIMQGTASLKDTLAFLQKSLPQLGESSAVTLLQSPEYARVLEEAFLQKWTITPEKIANKLPVTDLYDQLKEDLDKLSTLAKSGSSSEEILRFQEPVKNLQENLQFMKDLNEVFTFLQLPVRLKDREAHADLYVLTRKKAINDNRENLSVLLHLTMTNLGSLNVHLQMNYDQIKAVFYLEDSEARHLIGDNLPSFLTSLQAKGYSIQAEIKDAYKKPDFSRDFIEQNSQDNFIKRYTFDIRT